MIRARGSALAAVIFMVALLGLLSWWLSQQSNLILQQVTASQSQAATQLALDAALAHGELLAQTGSCPGDQSITGASFEEHSYSVTLQAPREPAVWSIPPSHDTWIKEAAPSDTYAADGELNVKSKAGDSFHALYQFDLGSIPAGTRIESGTLWLYVTSNDDVDAVPLHLNTALVDESSVNWSNFATSYDETSSIAVVPQQQTGSHWIRIPLTELIQRWINQPAQNMGFRLVAQSTDKVSSYTSKEYGQASRRPYLHIVGSDEASSTAEVTVSVTAPDGGLHTATKSTQLLQPAASISTADGITLDDVWIDALNHDTTTDLKVDATSRALLQLGVGRIPRGARVLEATLTLYPLVKTNAGTLRVHRLRDYWDRSQVNWVQARPFVYWDKAGGDFDLAQYGSGTLESTSAAVDFDVRSLVQSWLNGAPMHGLIVLTDDANATFASTRHSNASLHPTLTVRYACNCGQRCLHERVPDKQMLFVVGQSFALTEGERARLANFTDWGYVVEPFTDGSLQFSYNFALTDKDVVYVSNDASATSVGNKLNNTTVTVVSELGSLSDELGIAAGQSSGVGAEITLVDTNHSVSAALFTGNLALTTLPTALTTHTGLAPTAETHALLSTAPVMVSLAAGENTTGGSPVAGNRLILPVPADLDWGFLQGDALDLIESSLSWASGATTHVPVYCNADYEPLSVEEEISSTGFGSNVPTGMGFVPSGGTLNGVAAPSSGAWIVTDLPDRRMRLVDMQGNQLATATTPGNAPQGVDYVDSGTYEGHYILTDTAGGALYLLNGSGGAIAGIASSAYGTYAPTGIAFIDVTESGSYDQHAVFVGGDTKRAYLINDSFAVASNFNVGPDEPTGVSHLPGSDKILVTYKDSARIYALDGSLVRSYDAIELGAEDVQAVAIHGTTCMHTVLDNGPDMLRVLTPEDKSLPVAHWRLDETAGAVAADDAGGHDGTVSGAQWESSAVNGGGLEFASASDQVVVDYNAALALDGDVTVLAWINPSSLLSQRTVLKSGTHYSLGTIGDELFFEYVDAGGVDRRYTTSGSDLQPGNWYQVGATRNVTTNTIRLFVNGQEAHNAAAHGPAEVGSADPLFLGTDNGNDTFRGVLDDVRVYQIALESVDVYTLYTDESPPGGGGGGGPSCDYAADDFESDSWSGDSGNTGWASTWEEINESTNAHGGDNRVLLRSGNYVARVRDNDGGGEGIMRSINLLGRSMARLEFDYWRMSLDNTSDNVTVEYTSDSVLWHELTRIQGPGNDSTSDPGTPVNVNINHPLTSLAAIRFVTSATMGGQDGVYLDNIQIVLDCP